jgi:hypothetical protein
MRCIPDYDKFSLPPGRQARKHSQLPISDTCSQRHEIFELGMIVIVSLE